MNPDSPKTPQEEMETRLIALLVGELSDQEAAAWRAAIATNSELAKLHDRLKQTIGLVREATAKVTEPASEQAEPLQLSEERREKLFAHFKTVKPREFALPKRRVASWLVPMAATAMLVLLLAAIAIPNFRARNTFQAYSYTSAEHLGEMEMGRPARASRTLGTDRASAPSAAQNSPNNINSLNVVGYVNKPLTGGHTVVANPLSPPAAIQTSAGAALFDSISPPDSSLASTRGGRGPTVLSKKPTALQPDQAAPNVTPPPQIVLPPQVEVLGAPEFAKVVEGKDSLRDNNTDQKQVNVGLADGSVQPFSRSRLQEALRNSGDVRSNVGDQAVDEGKKGVTTWSADQEQRLFYERYGIPAQRDKGMSPAVAPPGPADTQFQVSGQVEGFYSDLHRTPPATPLPAGGAAIATNSLERSTFAGRGISPTTGLPVDNSSPNVGALGQTFTGVTRADLALTRSYDKKSVAQGGGLGGGGGGAGNLLAQSGLGGARGRRGYAGAEGAPVVAQKPSEKAELGDVVLGFQTAGATTIEPSADKTPVVGDAPAIGMLFRNEGGGEFSRLPSELPLNRGEESLRRQSSIVLPSSELAGEARVKDAETAPKAQNGRVVLEAGKPADAGGRLHEQTWGDYNSDGFLDSFSIARGKDSKEAGVELNSILKRSRQLAQKGTEVSKEQLAELEPEVRAAQQKVDDQSKKLEISDLDAAVAARSETTQEYFKARQNLEEQLQLRRNLNMKLAAEGVDSSLPKTSAGRIVELAQAQPKERPGLGERLKGILTSEVERSARIRVGPDVPVVGELGVAVKSDDSTYDPHFVQSDIEILQSRDVLGRVVEKLNLNEKWAAKGGAGEKRKTEETTSLLKQRIELRPVADTGLVDIRVKSDNPEEAARIANTIAEVYQEKLNEVRGVANETAVIKSYLAEVDQKVSQARRELERVAKESNVEVAELPFRKPATNAPLPQPEVQTSENAFSTFSLNVSDVSFKLAAASLEKGQMPEQASIRSEEFINAFDYRDPEPPPGMPVAFAWERARYPFAHNRDLLRFSLKTGAVGRQSGRALNLVLLLDNSGSMERADRVQIIREALQVLAGQLQPQDKISVITFARTPRLWVDGASGDKAGEVAEQVSDLIPQGGTNLEEAMNLAYQTALRHYVAGGINRVVVLTDGAANLGNVEPESLKQKVESHRKQGIALDCFGVGWEGFNDDLLEVLSRNGDGRYGFINSPEEAATEFAGQLAGALQVAASDVKVQVEFNPARVTTYRQIGYAKHQLTKEQFRDNTVDAAEIAAQEAGNALYAVEVNPAGEGPLCIVRVRFKFPGTVVYREHEWAVPYNGSAVSLEQASPAMRLAASASAFSEWLVASPFAAEVSPDALLSYLSGVPEIYGADARPKKLEWMIRQAKSIEGK